jgi:hypothetical protein
MLLWFIHNILCQLIWKGDAPEWLIWLHQLLGIG